MRKLGLIGGLGPGATVHYYRELVKAQAGEMLIIHADMDRVLGHVQPTFVKSQLGRGRLLRLTSSAGKAS